MSMGRATCPLLWATALGAAKRFGVSLTTGGITPPEFQAFTQCCQTYSNISYTLRKIPHPMEQKNERQVVIMLSCEGCPPV